MTVSSPKLDRVGMIASTACAIHCAAVPMLLGVLPVIGLGFLAKEWFEWMMVGIAAVVGLTAMWRGHKKHHHHRPVCFFISGLVILLVALIFWQCNCSLPKRWVFDTQTKQMVLIQIGSVSPWRAILMALGGLCVAASHFMNARLCKSCEPCHQECAH